MSRRSAQWHPRNSRTVIICNTALSPGVGLLLLMSGSTASARFMGVLVLQASIVSKLTIEEVDATHCRQTLEGDIDIKILGLGPIAEHIIASNLKSVYSGIPQIVDK